MKRWIHASDEIVSSIDELTEVDKVPNIDNQYLPAEVVIGWIDKLMEVAKSEKSTSNN